MFPKPAIEQGEHNSEPHTGNIRNPILHIRAAPEGRLDNLYETAKSACANKDRKQPNSASARKRKGESGKGNEVHDFIASIWCRGRRLQGPEHRDTQGERHGEREGDVEVLAHPLGCIDPKSQ